ncbi:gluconate kinase [Companilactobacillus crustorum]|uniref:Gluconate kinase n=3 Tax=Companilactobacillus TaxID=2767879 RepID=A0A837RF70_9LACO|nr:gluconokinase [Companilactobacillus crustorum]KRK41531.1 gluconate kinase [Companilactobacillus crustorum JCM 15951]KRO19198.1 gluconate kinase [Companilactobacillus crustorum]GEO77287.1 gluconate kinase [Companilactobacillus crustorum]
MDYMIGVDIGTTTTKSVLYDMKGKVVAYANSGYQLYQDAPDMAEEDPDDILHAVIEVMGQVMYKSKVKADEIKGVSFSSAMHSLILMDEADQPLTKAITWADNRAAKYSDELKDNGLGAKIYARTGTPIHPMAPLSKILWLRHEKPELFKKAKKFIDLKTYVFFKLFGVYRMDYSIASATGMFNIFDLKWNQGVLDLLQITEKQLPELVETTASISGIAPRFAELLNISTRTPFIFGASDGVLSNLGVDAIDPGVVAVTIGTSGAVRVTVDKPVVDPDGKLFCYALTKDKWVVGGPVNNGGIVFRWVKDQLFAPERITAEQMQVSTYDILTQIAEKIPAGSDGLLFHPYLGGERAPIWNAYARGSFFGLTRNHTRAHMVRAALEGIVYNLYVVMLTIEKVAGKPKSIQATGGFARSALWRQMLADIFEQPITIPESFESSCLGAAVLGMYALGYIDNLAAVKDMIGVTDVHKPNSDNFEVYRELLPIWIRISHLLEPEYKEIADFQRKHTK